MKCLTRSKIGREADSSKVCGAAHTDDAVERSTGYCAGQEANGGHVVCFSKESGSFQSTMLRPFLYSSLYSHRSIFLAIVDASLPLRQCGQYLQKVTNVTPSFLMLVMTSAQDFVAAQGRTEGMRCFDDILFCHPSNTVYFVIQYKYSVLLCISLLQSVHFI